MRTALVVDNLPAVRQAVARLVERCRPGTRVEEAASSAEALARCAAGPVGLVLTGMRLEGGERSLPLVERLLADAPARPVLLVTSLPRDHPDVVKALSLGAAAHLPKPVDPAQLRRALDDAEMVAGRRQRIP